MTRGWRKRLLCAAAAVGMLFPTAHGEGITLDARLDAYEAFAADGSVQLHTEFLTGADSAVHAAEAVRLQLNAMTEAQKANPADVDQASAFAEEAIAAVARKRVEGPEIHISRESTAELLQSAALTGTEVEAALRTGGVSVHRDLSRTVVFVTDRSEFAIVVHSDILETLADRIRVERTGTPPFAVTIRPGDLKKELQPPGLEPAPRTVRIVVREKGDAFEPGTDVPVPAVEVEVPEGQISAPVTLSLYPGSAEPSSLLIEGRNGEDSASRYNPATRTLDARVDATDVYTFGRGSVKFPDLVGKNGKLCAAVEALSRVNVVYGYADSTFRPDSSVTRAEFVAFVMRALGRVNNSLKAPFEDVTQSSACYHEIASAYDYGIINGYDALHFRGDLPISKTQIYAIVGRILTREMKYHPPADPAGYLAGEYQDLVAAWAQADVALATREGLVIRQEDGRFNGGISMNRGDVALIIYGLYQRLA